MIDIVGTLGQGLFSGFCMMLLASWFCSILYPIFLRLSRQLSIANQALSTLVYTLIAPLSACLGVVVLTHPAIAATVVYAHCHGRNCAPHVPAPITTSFVGSGLVALVTIGALLLLYLMTKKLYSAHSKQLFLEALASPEQIGAPLHYKVIESDELLAWCSGLFFPVVYVSRGLINKLTALQLNAVLAHEYGHVVRHDNMRKLLLFWSSAFWLPKLRGKVRLHFYALSEQLSDQYSAQITQQPELIKQSYQIVQGSSQNPLPIYAYRQLSEGETQTSLLLTICVYLLTSMLFVTTCIALTMIAHGLLEYF